MGSLEVAQARKRSRVTKTAQRTRAMMAAKPTAVAATGNGLELEAELDSKPRTAEMGMSKS